MRTEIVYRPSSTIAKVHLEPGEHLSAEGGAFVAMKGDVNFTTTTHKKGGGSIMKALRRMLAGESLFINHFEAKSPSEVWLGTPLPGDLIVQELKQQKLVIQGGSYVAATEGVDIDMEWQGLKSFLSGESIFWVKAHGTGQVIISSFGEIYSVDVDGEYIVDTGHVVAFEETLNFTISKTGSSWLHSFLGGEGFILRFQGKGKVWIQSHSARSFGMELRPHLRPKKG